MSKLYLLCGLNDENYTQAEHSFYKSYKDALQAVIDSCNEWEESCEIEIEDDGYRITARYYDSFYVTEIKQICPECGTHLLIWHHGYEGVDFEVRLQGTYEECEREMKKEIYKLVNDLELTEEDICDNVIDTGNEWEVFDIVEIKE
ncbi:MAG TPA: hypothetical protein DCW90_22805 [Lachnospiraceae bacterium]|nr:hypothetical protein [Lachnospiraceae bacterium]